MTSTTTTGRTYGALVHRETHAEGSRWAFDIPVPGAVGQAWRARPARGSEKPRSGRRGTGDRDRQRRERAEIPFPAGPRRLTGTAGVGSGARGIIVAWGEDGPPGMTLT